MLMIKSLHIACAYLTGLGFVLRGLLILQASSSAQHRLMKILPHIIDSILFTTGLAMVVSWSLWPSQQPWLATKLLVLLLYIGFGMLMIRWGTTARRRTAGLLGGLCCYLYILGAAWRISR